MCCFDHEFGSIISSVPSVFSRNISDASKLFLRWCYESQNFPSEYYIPGITKSYSTEKIMNGKNGKNSFL